MASFMTDLWESIFTPGPTAPLLKAANLSFAALQTVLLGLLVATYNPHCVVLSILCAGLWWSINWFAAEVKAAQLREEQEKKEKEKESGGKRRRRKGKGEVDDSSDTEVESAKAVPGAVGRESVSASAEVETHEQTGELKKRAERELTPPTTGTQSSASTEDEWEKVSESEPEKDK